MFNTAVNDYNVYRKDRKAKGGGVVIYVKDILAMRIITASTKFKINISKYTLIYLLLTNRSLKYPHSGVFAQGISDHCPTACIKVVRRTKSKGRVTRKQMS